MANYAFHKNSARKPAPVKRGRFPHYAGKVFGHSYPPFVFDYACSGRFAPLVNGYYSSWIPNKTAKS